MVQIIKHISEDMSLILCSAGAGLTEVTDTSTVSGASLVYTTPVFTGELLEIVIISPSAGNEFICVAKGTTSNEVKLDTRRVDVTDSNGIYNQNLSGVIVNEALTVTLSSLDTTGDYTIKVRYR